MELKEKKLDSELIYKGHILDLYRDKVLCPNGNESYREVIRHSAAVCVLAELDGKFILEEQYRYPYDDIILEFPAGKVDPNEDYEKAAIRELEEETGYLAGNIKLLGKMYPTVAYTDEVIYLYYANNLKETKRHLDENEAINFKFYTMDEIENLVRSGKILDAKSQSILYFYSLEK